MPGVPARIAVQIQPQHADYADIRRLCATLEDIGVDVLFNWDHFFPLNGDPDGRHFEAWTCSPPGRRPRSAWRSARW